MYVLVMNFRSKTILKSMYRGEHNLCKDGWISAPPVCENSPMMSLS